MLESELLLAELARRLLQTGPVRLDLPVTLELLVTLAPLEPELHPVTLEVLLLHHGQIRLVLLVTQARAGLQVTQEIQADPAEPVEPHLIHGPVQPEQQELLVTSEPLVPLVLAQLQEILGVLLLPTGPVLPEQLATRVTQDHPVMLVPVQRLVDQAEQLLLVGLDLLVLLVLLEIPVQQVMQGRQERLEAQEHRVEVLYSV